MRLATLVVPIFIENMLRTSLMAVDQLMLYSYSEKAAAAMSTVNQLAFFLQILYSMVAVGSGILISQNLGADKRTEAGRTATAGFVMATLLSLFVGVAVVLAVPHVLGAFSLEPEVYRYGATYLTIYAAGSTFMAMNIAQASILRSYGFARDPMLVNILVLLLNILGNSVSLFGPFGLPVFGVAGVAVSTVLSQVAAFFFLARRIRKKGALIEFRLRDARLIPPGVYRSILAVGLPTVGENVSYNVAQITVISFIARMGTEALAAYGLVITLSRYVFISGVSIGQAAQILVGYLTGAGQYDRAQRSVYRYFLTGVSISVGAVLLLNLFKGPILGLFTRDAEISSLAAAALLVGLFLEPGRNFNTIIVPSLKGSGDVRFPVAVGVCFMWAVGVFGSWLFGLVWGFGLTGVWIALSLDEWSRGFCMLLRWRSGAWKKKTLVAR